MVMDLTMFAADEAELCGELPATLVFSDQEVIGMVGPDTQGQSLGTEGFTDDRNMEARVLVTRFATPKTAPFLNQTVTHKETGKKYRIQTVLLSLPDALTYIMTLVETTR